MEWLFSLAVGGLVFLWGQWDGKRSERKKQAALIDKLRSNNASMAITVNALADKLRAYEVEILRLRSARPTPAPPGLDAVSMLPDDFLMDLLKLAHPDRHPPERKELATKVTQRINTIRSSR